MLIWNELPPTHERARKDCGKWSMTVAVVKDREEKIIKSEVGNFPISKEPTMAGELGVVGTTRGITLNLGNYESARVDVFISLPTTIEEVENTYGKCEDFVESKLEEEVNAIRESMSGE